MKKTFRFNVYVILVDKDSSYAKIYEDWTKIHRMLKFMKTGKPYIEFDGTLRCGLGLSRFDGPDTVTTSGFEKYYWFIKGDDSIKKIILTISEDGHTVINTTDIYCMNRLLHRQN